MERKFFLFIAYNDSDLRNFALYDSEEAKLYIGTETIKSSYSNMNYYDMLKKLKYVVDSKLIQISKESFFTFINFNFLKLKQKTKAELYKTIGLEEYFI
jgi:hypothetical protein